MRELLQLYLPDDLPEPVLLQTLSGELVEDGISLAPHCHVLALGAVGRLAPPPVAALLPFPAVAIPVGITLHHLCIL